MTLYADGAPNSPFNITGVNTQGTYTVDLIEGSDLPQVQIYPIRIVVDNASASNRNVAVYDFEGSIIPDDNFTGHSMTNMGISETAELGVAITPTGVRASDIGGLDWAATGVGTLTGAGAGDGTASYDAGQLTGSVTFDLQVTSGKFQGKRKSYNQTIVAPSSGYLARFPGSGIYHRQNFASVGFHGLVYMQPMDVSFSNIQMREGTTTGTGSGFYTFLDGTPHATSSWFPIGNCSATTGCAALLTPTPWDEVMTGDFGPPTNPFSPGNFSWPIPWQYLFGTSSAITFYTANHQQSLDAQNNCCLQKAGVGPICKNVTDADSNF